MRRLLIPLILVLVLAALIGISRWAADWHYILPAEPGKLMYVATFDGTPDDWELYEGKLSAQVTDGALRVDVDDFNTLGYSAARPFMGDFDLSVEMRAVDGPVNNGYGVIFHLTNRKNYYLFLVSSDGFYQVVRGANGEEHELSTWIESPLINQGLDVTNRVRVVARGSEYQFYINGQRVELCIPNEANARSTYVVGECIGGTMTDTLVDDSLPTGQIGVAALTLNESGVTVDFDNMLVYGPEG